MSLTDVEKELAQLDPVVPWMLQRRVRLRLTQQWLPLLDKWHNDREHWTEDDQYVYVHYHAADCMWDDLMIHC